MESSQYKYQVSNIHLFLNMNSMLLTRLPVKVEESPLISKFTSRIATPHHPNTAYLIDKRRVIEEWTSAKVYECIDENYFNKQGLSPAQNLKARNQSSHAILQIQMYVDILTRPACLKYGRSILSLFIEINRKVKGLPPLKNIAGKEAEQWRNANLEYPQHVLRYDQLFLNANENKLIVVTADYKEYKPLTYFIERARLAGCQKKEQSVLMLKAMEQQTQNEPIQEYYYCQKLSEAQILTIIRKVIIAFREIQELEEKINKQGLGFILSKFEEESIKLLRYLNPQQDILVHPETLDVKIYNFGFKEDIEVSMNEYKMSLADSNFIYRFPENAVLSYQAHPQHKYISNFLKEGLQEVDLVWMVGLLIYRVFKGCWPFQKKDEKEIRIIGKVDMEWAFCQLKKISQLGLDLEKSHICQALSNQMLTNRIKLKECQARVESKLNQLSFQSIELVVQRLKKQKNNLVSHSILDRAEDKEKRDSKKEFTSKHKIIQKDRNRRNSQVIKTQQKIQMRKRPLKQINKHIRLTIEPLCWALGELSSISNLEMNQISVNKVNQDILFIQMKLTEFKIILELRRRCKNFLFGHPSSGFDPLEKLKNNVNKIINSESPKKNQKPKRSFLKLRSQIGIIIQYFERKIEECNELLLIYCPILNQILDRNETSEGTPLHNIKVLVDFYMDLIYWTNKIQNISYKNTLIQEKLQFEKKKNLDEIIESEIKGCIMDLKQMIQFIKETKIDRNAKIGEVLCKVGKVLGLDNLMKGLQLNGMLEAEDLEIFEELLALLKEHGSLVNIQKLQKVSVTTPALCESNQGTQMVIKPNKKKKNILSLTL